MKRFLVILMIAVFFLMSASPADALFGIGKKETKPKAAGDIASSGIVNVGQGAVSPDDTKKFQEGQAKKLEENKKRQEAVRRQQEAERMQQIRQQGAR
ncbi:MAG: hypothetical protein HQ594_02795 [Candidatus Omnitrophica bacterium]|nr:hypothetical protein [Candidatus Omnitrophota bacterium]